MKTSSRNYHATGRHLAHPASVGLEEASAQVVVVYPGAVRPARVDLRHRHRGLLRGMRVSTSRQSARGLSPEMVRLRHLQQPPQPGASRLTGIKPGRSHAPASYRPVIYKFDVHPARVHDELWGVRVCAAHLAGPSDVVTQMRRTPGGSPVEGATGGTLKHWSRRQARSTDRLTDWATQTRPGQPLDKIIFNKRDVHPPGQGARQICR